MVDPLLAPCELAPQRDRSDKSKVLRECLASDVADLAYQVRANIEVLTRLVSAQGEPRYLRSDNGPAFVALNSLQPVTEDL